MALRLGWYALTLAPPLSCVAVPSQSHPRISQQLDAGRLCPSHLLCLQVVSTETSKPTSNPEFLNNAFCLCLPAPLGRQRSSAVDVAQPVAVVQVRLMALPTIGKSIPPPPPPLPGPVLIPYAHGHPSSASFKPPSACLLGLRTLSASRAVVFLHALCIDMSTWEPVY